MAERIWANGGAVEYGALYEKILNGTASFDASIRNVDAKLFGAKNVSYIIGKNGDSYLLTAGSYSGFTGTSAKNGLGLDGVIGWVGLYKNGAWQDFGDGIYDIKDDFEKPENHIATIPVYGLTVRDFLSILSSSYDASSLIRRLCNSNDWISGDRSDSTVVDGFDGNDEFYIGTRLNYARAGAGDDLFVGTPAGAAVLSGGLGNDQFDGSSGLSDQSKQFLWVGGAGQNRYIGPGLNTIVVIDQKTTGQPPDIISYADLILAKPSQKSGYVVIATTHPDVSQLDIRFVNQPLLDQSGKEVEPTGYFSVLYKGVEQVKISPMAGGWSLDGFIAESKTYEDNIRAAIAVATFDQLIVPQYYSDTALSQIKQDFGNPALGVKQAVDLTGQRLLDKVDYVPIANRFYLNQIAQNAETGQLEFIFSHEVGSVGSIVIYELDVNGRPVRQSYLQSQVKQGNKVITSISNTKDTQYIAALTSGWSSSSGASLEGQGSLSSPGVSTYKFTFGKDTLKPTITSVQLLADGKIQVIFSEPVKFTDSNLAAQIGLLSRKQTPTSLADVAYSFKLSDAQLTDKTLLLTPPSDLDGDYYFFPAGIKDYSDNYLQTNWQNATRLTFENLASAANRFSVERKNGNSFLLPLKVNHPQLRNKSYNYGSISFVWKDALSQATVQGYLGGFESRTSDYLYSLDKPGVPMQVFIDDFAPEGTYKLSNVNVYKDGNNEYSDTPEEIGQLLKSWDLAPGSLDFNLLGESLSFAPIIAGFNFGDRSIDLSNPFDALIGSFKFDIATGNRNFDKLARVSSVQFEYQLIGQQYEYSRLYFNLDSADFRATWNGIDFKLDANQSSFLNAKVGDYVLSSLKIEWQQPHWNQLEYTTDQLKALRFPTDLKIEKVGQKPEPQKRELIELSVSQAPVFLTGQPTLCAVSARVKISNFDILNQSFLEERLSLSYINEAANAARQNNPAFNSLWSDSINNTLSPSGFQFNSVDGSALVTFNGYLDIAASQFDGAYTLDSATLFSQGQYRYDYQLQTYLNKDSLKAFNHTVQIKGGQARGSSFALRDVDVPVLSIPPQAASVYKLELGPQKINRTISLNLYVNEPGRFKKLTKPANNSFNDLYSTFFNVDQQSEDLRGFATLESPSGLQSKLITIHSSDRLDPEEHWKRTYPDVQKYAAELSFTTEDEPGTWRLSTLAKIHPNGTINWDYFDEDTNVVSVGVLTGNGLTNELSTEVMASRLKLDPSRLQLELTNPFYKKAIGEKDLDIIPAAQLVDCSFEKSQMAAGSRQSLTITVNSSRPFLNGELAYALVVTIGHANRHIVSMRQSDIRVLLRTEDVVTVVAQPDGSWQTILKRSFDVPDSFYSGNYCISDISMVPVGIASSFTSVFQKYRGSAGRTRLLTAGFGDEYYYSDSLAPRIIPAFSQVEKAFLDHQLAQSGARLKNSQALEFKVTGKPVDRGLLNPDATIGPNPVSFEAPKADLSSSEQVPIGVRVSNRLLERLRSSSSDGNLNWGGAPGSFSDSPDLWLLLVHKQSGAGCTLRARYVSGPDSGDMSIYSLFVDKTLAGGEYRLIDINFFSPALGGAAEIPRQVGLDGVSASEDVVLDRLFGPKSSLLVVNPDPLKPSLSLMELGFSDVESTPEINLSVTPASVSEDGRANLMFAFSRSGSTAQALSVQYNLGGTASLGSDYTGIASSAVVKTISFAAGSTTVSVSVDPVADSSVEPNETVSLTLLPADGYAVGTTSSVVGTIANDDVPPLIAISVNPAAVMEDGSQKLSFTLTRTGSSAKSLTVLYSVGGTASLLNDYSGIAIKGSTKSLTFAAGALKASLLVDPISDVSIEPNETVSLSLLPGDGYALAPARTATATLLNDDIGSATTRTLSDGQSSLQLTGSAVADAIGNSLPNKLIGNSARNTLDGRAGTDQLTGLAGGDTFLFSTKPLFGASSADRITDFSVTQGDRLQISRAAFGIGRSERISFRFINKTADLAAAAASPTLFVYDRSRGELCWNQNGATPGFGGGGIFVVLENKSPLDAAQINLV